MTAAYSFDDHEILLFLMKILDDYLFLEKGLNF